ILNGYVVVVNQNLPELNLENIQKYLVAHAVKIEELRAYFSKKETIGKETVLAIFELTKKCCACNRDEIDAVLTSYMELKKFPAAAKADLLGLYLMFKPVVDVYTAHFQLRQEEIPADLALFIREMDAAVGVIMDTCVALLPDFATTFSREDAKLFYQNIKQQFNHMYATLDQKLTMQHEAIHTPEGIFAFRLAICNEALMMGFNLVNAESSEMRKKAILNLWCAVGVNVIEKIKMNYITYETKEIALEALKKELSLMEQEFKNAIAEAYGIHTDTLEIAAA
ncbi:hypothetical protein KKC59_00155, partial [bacterium]|nr:hypothetical protein [bacterium]